MADFKPLTKNKKGVPICPNHGEPLEGIGHPIPPSGTGICPVSKCPFDYSINVEQGSEEYVKDHSGNLTAVPTFKVIGDDNG